MREIIKMIECYFKEHIYHWHYSDSPHNTKWFQCSRCGKIKHKPKF